METNISSKTILAVKIIVFFYWLLGLQRINYNVDEFTLAGLQRRIYPTMIILCISVFGIIDACFSGQMISGVVIRSVSIVQLILVTVLSALAISFDSLWHSEKKLRFYNNLNKGYNNLYESHYLKSMAIRKVLILYLFYLWFLITQNVMFFWSFGFNMMMLHNVVKGAILDMMVLQLLVEIYFCVLGFKSFNENLLDLNYEGYGDKYLNGLTDFKRISICPNLYDCEWFEMTKKRKQSRNFQTTLYVYEILMENIEIISARFGILVSATILLDIDKALFN